MPHAVVTALGPDRPGIVARVSRVLLDHGCNIADSHMGLLSGRFTMMLVVTVPEDLPEQRFLDALTAAGRDVGLDAIHAHRVADAMPGAPATHAVTVYGADHPGIVAAVAEALAARGASITDLQTRLAEDLYVMTLEVSGADLAQDDLRATAAAQDVEISIRPLDTDVL